VRQVITRLGVDGDAEGMNPVTPGVDQGLARILNAVGTTIGVVIVRLAVREGDKQFGTCLDLL
jgi:hypothetical protein